MKCKKGEVQGRLRTDWVGGMHPKHALECLRHGADIYIYILRQGSALGPKCEKNEVYKNGQVPKVSGEALER